MIKRSSNHTVKLAVLSLVFAALTGQAGATEYDFSLEGGNKALRRALLSQSLVNTVVADKSVDARDILAASLAEYSRLTNALYAAGYYGGQVNVTLDGIEAANIPLFNEPKTVAVVRVVVNPGSPFRFSKASIAPLAPKTKLSRDFQAGKPALASEIQGAVDTAALAWRNVGHAKVRPKSQNFTADHADNTLAVDVELDPGPVVRFGDMTISTPSAVRSEKIRRIAGLPSGEVFSPTVLARSENRLRRTGAFSSVATTESATLGPDDTMDIDFALVDEKPHRYGVGGTISTNEGLGLSAFWMHRNTFGGAERLRFDAEISNIGGETGGIDYALGARLDQPGAFGADTDAFYFANLERLDEPNFRSDQFTFGVGAQKTFTDHRKADLGIAYRFSDVTDNYGSRKFNLLTFPFNSTWDHRNRNLDPSRGYYLKASATPYIGLNGSATGARLFFDSRVYRNIGQAERVVLAGRFQVGSVLGSSLSETAPDYLFYSGGSATVRGHPYQSLAISQGGIVSGGRSFMGASAEIRAKITKNVGWVLFYDTGYIGANSFIDATGGWHSGAGVGLRYLTGLGPIRLDIAKPVSGASGNDLQIYLGIGQAF